MPPGTFAIVLNFPARVTARKFWALPLLEAENQISAPVGDQATPSRALQPEESFLSWPSRSITATEPSSSPSGFSWSAKAISLPSGEIFGVLIQLIVSNKTFPTGYSRRQWKVSGTKRTTAIFWPSTAQSASWTLARTSLGEPPLSGTLARVPERR